MEYFQIQKCVLVREDSAYYDKQISNSDDIAELGKSLGFAEAAEEHFVFFSLNIKGKVIAFHDVSHGDLSTSVVHPREVFKRAILNNAAGIILMHNHPSGDPAPSQDDISTTKRLREAGDLLGIKVLDHIILGDNSYFGFQNEGLMDL